MEVRLVPYSDSLKESLFAFTAGCFEELGKKFEPDGRHGFYNDIENEFDVFYCLDSMSKYEDALRLYGKTGFRRIERYNDNVHADVFMRLDL